tara:strand:- start:117 stop:347 length:231 start_codon:yes stop_codon:yes gene_type:complete
MNVIKNNIFIMYMDYFTRHPKEHKMTYVEHFIFSSVIGWNMALHSIQAFIHAINPNWCEDSTTMFMHYLNNAMKNR